MLNWKTYAEDIGIVNLQSIPGLFLFLTFSFKKSVFFRPWFNCSDLYWIHSATLEAQCKGLIPRRLCVTSMEFSRIHSSLSSIYTEDHRWTNGLASQVSTNKAVVMQVFQKIVLYVLLFKAKFEDTHIQRLRVIV